MAEALTNNIYSNQHIARNLFLCAVQEKVPIVLSDLSAKSFEAFKSVALTKRDYSRHRELWDDFFTPFRSLPPIQESPLINYLSTGKIGIPTLLNTSTQRSLKNLRNALLTWARSYNLKAGWVFEFVISTLVSWRTYERSDDEAVRALVGKSWSLGTVSYVVKIYNPLKAEIDPYRPDQQDKAKYRRKAHKDFAVVLEEYLADKPEGFTKRESDHFLILALYQCGKRTQNKLAEQFMLTRPTIQSALRDSAQLIDLKLRSKGQ